MKLRPLTMVFAFLIGCGVGLQAQTYIWTGLSNSYSYEGYYDGANWQGGLGPALPGSNPGNDIIIFGNVQNTLVTYYEIKAHQLQFTGHTRPYQLEAFYGATIYLGAGGIVYSPAGNVASVIDDSIVLTANQTWNIAGGSLAIWGSIYNDVVGNRMLTKTGAGTLLLDSYYNDYSDFSGGFVIKDGRVVVRPKLDYYYYPIPITSLGSGTVTFDSSAGTPTLVAALHQNFINPVIVSNPIAINGVMRTENHSELYLTGPVTLESNAVISTAGKPLYIEGGISGTGKSLTINSAGMVVLDPGATESINTYDGGTHVQNGLLIFGNEDAIPATGTITVASTGYAGLAAIPDYGISAFIAKFDPANTHGTIGFDSDPNWSTNVFTDPIDLTGFSATARLGSATHAALIGTITPQGADYRFGGGGGYLSVLSDLTGARNLVGASPAALPLTVYLGGSNDFTGFVSASHTAFIFDTVNPSLPAGATLQLQQGGYIGLEDAADPQAFINRFDAGTAHGMIGFNGYNYTTTISAALNLGAFTGPVYLGTTQRGYTDDGIDGGVRLQGAITPAADGIYRFAGYKGGMLRVESDLSGSAGMHIGDPTSPATFGDYLNDRMSVVVLAGNNSGLSGNVTLYGGELFLGNANALGTGSLIVNGMTLPTEWHFNDGLSPAPVLSTYGGFAIDNNVVLNTRLDVGEYSNLELNGLLSGSGQLYLREDTSVTLNANNTGFTGGIYLSGSSNLRLGADHATGTGPLSFGYGSYGTVEFLTANPVIFGLVSGPNDSNDLYAKANNTRLTVNQDFDSTFRGNIESYDSTGLRFVKAGAGTLHWQYGYSIPSGGLPEPGLPGSPSVSLEVQGGRLILGSSFYSYYSTNETFWVRTGATLALDNTWVENPIALDPGARLAGRGWLDNVSIGNGAILSPGLAGLGDIGTLSFSHLELDPGGILEWHIQNPNAGPGMGYDHIEIYGMAQTLVINATSEDPFSLKIISLNTGGSAGLLDGLTPGESYNWTIFTFDAISGGFDPTKFALDLSLFQTALGDGLAAGDFSLSLSGDNLMLNFTAVPEPSTYALMALGLAFVGWTVWRRRRA